MPHTKKQEFQARCTEVNDNPHDAMLFAAWLLGISYLPSWDRISKGEAEFGLERLNRPVDGYPDSVERLLEKWNAARNAPDPTLAEWLQ